METDHFAALDPKTLGDRLRDARKASGLTQEEAAQRMEFLRTTLVAIEKGDRKVSPEELIRFAALYGRAVSEFVSSRANKTAFVPQFRAPANLKSATEHELTVSAVALDGLARDYVELEEMTEMVKRPSFPPPYALDVPGVTPDQRGEEVAAEERMRLGIGDGSIADLRSLLEEGVGLRVFYVDLPSKIGGLFACNDELGGCIAINRNHPLPRANWSLAHEYAHFLTTRYQADVSFVHEYWGKANAERFADSFAKHFLMPRNGILRRLSDAVQAHGKGVTIADVMVLAHSYRVSAEAMFRRLEELKRIPAGTWDRKLKERGFKPDVARSELGLSIDGCQPPLPLRYRLLARTAYESKGLLTEGQLARKLRVDRVSARLELESLRQMADYAGPEGAEPFTPLELDAGSLAS